MRETDTFEVHGPEGTVGPARNRNTIGADLRRIVNAGEALPQRAEWRIQPTGEAECLLRIEVADMSWAERSAGTRPDEARPILHIRNSRGQNIDVIDPRGRQETMRYGAGPNGRGRERHCSAYVALAQRWAQAYTRWDRTRRTGPTAQPQEEQT